MCLIQRPEKEKKRATMINIKRIWNYQSAEKY